VNPKTTSRLLVDSDWLARFQPEILIVDADASSRAELRTYIAPMARVVEVGSGEEAIEVAPTRELAAILIDVDLPDCDGFQTVTRLRLDDNTRNVPVLFLSYEVPEWFCEKRGYELGALGYLRKPIDEVALRAKLDVLLTLYRRGVELRRKTAEAEVKDIYMGVLGHDLRTPLSAILMTARMLLLKGQLGDMERASVSRMARNAERMASLIRDILDYTRNQTLGVLPIMRRSVDMGEACAAIIEELALLHPERTLQLARGKDLQGMWDGERVEQVLTNLLANAVQHGRGDIQIAVDGVENAVLVRVHNGGNTIPPDEIPTLFEPFRRGSESRLGLGLGLYIVREIMRAHGGSVEVTSTPESGTTFTTRWPRR
jgi:signal transduction histidine kinase